MHAKQNVDFLSKRRAVRSVRCLTEHRHQKKTYSMDRAGFSGRTVAHD